MFWGLIMEPQKRYTQTVKRSFHVSMAALDIGSASNEPTQVICAFEERNYLLCTLKIQNLLQVPLDLNFEVGDQVSFATNGKSHVHLTGYLVEDDHDEHESKFEEESNDAESVTRKRTQLDNDTSPPKKKSKVLELLDAVKDEDDSDDSDFEISDMEEEGDVTVMDEQEEEVDEEEVDEDEAEAESSDENEEEQEDSDNVEEGVGFSDDDDDEDDDEEEEEISLKENGLPLIKTRKQAEALKAKKQDKKQNEKVVADGKMKSAKSPTKADKKGDKTPSKGDKSPAKKEAVAVPKRTVEGGVIIEDLKLGNGQVAKNGKLVQVYYEGILKSNNKTFDSTMKGPGFRFRLGKQEVIRGWDVGVLGMKVGGKRRVVCPPTMAYGQKGSPPVIPPNSTLVFDIELKNVN